MNNPYPCAGTCPPQPGYGQQQHPQAQQYPQAPAPQSYIPFEQQPYGTPQQAYPGSANQWQQAGAPPPYAPQPQQWPANTYGLNPAAEWPAQQPQQEVQQQQQHEQTDGSGADGSRGLGTGLLGAAHKMHKVGLVAHHIAHPIQGLKYHTVDKVKRKVKAKMNHMVDKVLP